MKPHQVPTPIGTETMKQRRQRIIKEGGARVVKRSTGEWIVQDNYGRPIATGFDTEAEAQEWIDTR